MTSTSSTTGPDRWHHYAAASNRSRSAGRLYWDWYQRIGPGDELLGDLTDCTVADLGAGAGHQAAYVAAELGAARVVAIDSSAAQHARSNNVYGDVCGLDFVLDDAATYLQAHPGCLDVVYSIFGALDFTDPRALLPAASAALRPGGFLVFSTLARYRTGAPPETECRPADIATRMPDGSSGTVQRWVLGTSVWRKLLDEHGFDVAYHGAVHDSGRRGEAPPMTTALFRARKRDIDPNASAPPPT
ncbi:class I SAM-dependent methyltransferase [Streptomyces baarnensis]|uniref:class I SAM-dependent methyltransferase n=1 Tax=Streptomyces baarnensis TaxID=66872 RepID=UPI00067C2CD4|nr:class I SAM-dependent methyltransferase [Streptomyces baarnensis]